MPTVFGPSLIPDRSTWGHVEMVNLTFMTSRRAASALVPAGVEVVGERPLVSVSRMTYADVDYLAGGGYNEITVGISSRVVTATGAVAGMFMPVVWVDEPVPLQIGREFLGYAKIFGNLPAVGRNPSEYSFELRERGSVLLRGRAFDVRALSADRFAAVRRSGADVCVLGWKYIPGLDGTADADYPTRIPLSFDWSDGFYGRGELSFESPGWSAAPIGSRAVEALAALAVLTPVRAIVATGHGSIDRGAARRLLPSAPMAGSAS
jgi:acetoacetate decarboxylase